GPTLHEELAATRTRAGDARPRSWLRAEAARRTSARRARLPEHLLRRDVEPRLPDDLPAFQCDRRRGVRAGVPAGQAGAAAAACVRHAARDPRIADPNLRLRRPRVLRLLRMGLHERRLDVEADEAAAACSGSIRAPSA